MEHQADRECSLSENCLTHEELAARVKVLKTVFDIVRIVDPAAQHQLIYHDDGTVERDQNFCFDLWQKESRCANCVSSRTLSTKKKATKFEFVNHEIYLVVAEYLEVDSRPCVMEAILHLDDTTLLGAYGKNEFISRINRYNDRAFTDSLTGIRNRRYYDEQISGLTVQAAAMMDIDHFKQINDTWGHQAGDRALQTVAKAISSCIRKGDMLLRYGGDELLLAFEDIPEEVFGRKLKNISETAAKAEVPGYPDIHITISIGGVYEKGLLKDRVRSADRALYEAKKKRNNVVIVE